MCSDSVHHLCKGYLLELLRIKITEDSFYIQILHWFSNLDSHDYKNLAHSKKITFPQYTAMILAIRIGHENLSQKKKS